MFHQESGAITAPATGKAIYGNIGLATVPLTSTTTAWQTSWPKDYSSFTCFGSPAAELRARQPNLGNIVNTATSPTADLHSVTSTATAIWTSSATRWQDRPTGSRTLSQRPSEAELGEGAPVGLCNHGAAGQRFGLRGGYDKLLCDDEVIIRAKQVQQNYYSLPDTERHFGLGAATCDVMVHFYPSNKEVKQSGVAANDTVRIGEDGMGMIVPPMMVNPTIDGGTPGGADDSGAAGGPPASSGGSAGMVSMAQVDRLVMPEQRPAESWCERRRGPERRGRRWMQLPHGANLSRSSITWLLPIAALIAARRVRHR